MTLALAGLLLGCPAKRKAAGPIDTVEDRVTAGSRRARVDGGSYWTEAGGLCLEVPADWSGTSGSPPHVLSLEHTASEVRLDVWVYGELPPDDRPGFSMVYRDDDSYRTVPVLGRSGTATWLADADKGPTLQAWRAELAGRWVSVETTFPFGMVTEGRDVVEPLLSGLCTTLR